MVIQRWIRRIAQTEKGKRIGYQEVIINRTKMDSNRKEIGGEKEQEQSPSWTQ